MLPERLEERMARISPIPSDLEVAFDGKQGPGVQGDAPELLPFADHVRGATLLGPLARDSETGPYRGSHLLFLTPLRVDMFMWNCSIRFVIWTPFLRLVYTIFIRSPPMVQISFRQT